MINLLSRRVRRLSAAFPPRPFIRPTLERLEDRLTPAVSFGPLLGFPSGGGPTAVASADFNGDGRPDLVVANGADGEVSVLLDTAAPGATAPSFTFQVTFAVGPTPTSLAVGDFNGDGRPDLAVANSNGNTVSVLLNVTSAGSTIPSFAAQVAFAVGHSPRSVAVADFNGDGKPDLAVANYADNTVGVLLNTATGAGESLPFFAAQKTFAAGPGPYSVAAADFNGDGKADLAVGYFGGNTVSALLNTASAGATTAAFTSPKTFAAGNNPDFVTAADFSGDGRPDLAVVNETDGTVSVLLDTAADGAAAASFAAQKTFAVGSDPRSLTAADLNGDGRPDLAVANFASGTVSVLANATAAGATTASFAAQVTFAAGDNPDSVVGADFNGDGRPDFAVACQSDNNVQVRFNTTSPFAVTGPPLVADIHGLGVVEYNRLTGAWVQLNPGNPADVSLLAADPQGDVFADYTGYGVARYTPSLGSWQMVVGADAVAIAVDARGDLFASFNGAGVGLFRLDGSASLLTPVTAALLASNAQGDLVGDFTGYGVQRRTAFSGMWLSVNGIDARAVAIDGAGDVFASFNGAGIGEFRLDGSASLLSTSAATRLSADPLGDLTAYIPGQGVVQYLPFTAGRTILPDFVPASALAMDDGGVPYADFTGYGLFEYDPILGWRRLNASDVMLLAVT